MHLVDILVIAAYLLTLVAIGLRCSRRQGTTESYFVAGRSVPGWAAGLSLMATIITSVTFIAYPGAAYAGDWSLLVPGIMFVLVIAAISPVVVPFFRQAVSMSVYEYFGKRFGRTHGDLLDLYRMEGAEYALLAVGTAATTSRLVVDRLRAEGKKVGLIRLRFMRPFPREELLKAVTGLRALGVFDRSVAFNSFGPVFTEVGPRLLEACTFVHMDAFGDTARLAAGPQFWPSTYWGPAVAGLTDD